MKRHALRLEITDRCPVCDGELVMRRRKADGGSFAGCSGFPDCTFAADAGDQDLRAEVLDLRQRLAQAKRQLPLDTAVLDRGLRAVIAHFHPDRHPGGLVSAHAVTSELNRLRQEMRS